MASSEDFVTYVCGQLAGAGQIRARKMFGEYGVYCDGVFFALICDNQFFIKITEAGRKFWGPCEEKPPYPGAKNYFLADDLENAPRLADWVRVTCSELAAPRVKKQRKK